jgi:hypothetical protein
MVQPTGPKDKVLVLGRLVGEAEEDCEVPKDPSSKAVLGFHECSKSILVELGKDVNIRFSLTVALRIGIEACLRPLIFPPLHSSEEARCQPVTSQRPLD